MLYGIHMSQRYGLGNTKNRPMSTMIAIQQTAADLIIKARSRGPWVFLMLKY